MIIIGLTILFLTLIILGVWGIIKNRHDNDNWWWCAVLSGICLAVLWAIVVGNYIGHTISIAQRQAFHDYNVENYAAAISRTKAILSEAEYAKAVTSLVAGSVEKIEVGAAAATRIKEWRDQVNEYNNVVATMRAIRGSLLIPGFLIVPPIPEGLTPLVITN